METETLRTLMKLLAHHRRLLPVCCAIIVFVSALTVVLPLYTKFLLEYIVPEKASRLLDISFLLFLGFLLIRFVFTALQDLAVVVLRQKLERNYNERYLEAVFRLKLAELQKHKAGEIINRFSVFINEIEWFLCDIIFFVFYALFIFVVLSFLMVAVNPLLYLVVIAFIPLHVVNFTRFAGKLRDASEDEQKQRGELSSFVLQSVDGWSDIRNYFLQEHFAEGNRKQVSRMNRAYFVRKRFGFLQQGYQSALIIVNHIAVVALSVYQITAGRTTVGTMFFFLLLLEFFYSPIYRFSAVNEALQAACVKIRRMAELIENQAVEAPVPARLPTPAAVTTMTLEGLSFEGVFHDLNYRFTRGTLYFITGPSGCGKTTLFHLMTRMYDASSGPFSGTVALDGEDTSSWPEPAVRSYIQSCTQESLLFKRSIALNIHLGDPEAVDHARLRKAAYHATADRFIDALPNRYDHEVQEGGSNLSGGEQQRLNMTRAFYYDAPILLLDEPTSALDAATESLFFERLQEIKQDKIILIINHRDQTLQYADVILRLTATGLVEVQQPLAAHS